MTIAHRLGVIGRSRRWRCVRRAPALLQRRRAAGPRRGGRAAAGAAHAQGRAGVGRHAQRPVRSTSSPRMRLSVIERLGYESGVYDTFIRTDSNIIARQPKKTTGEAASGGPSLAMVDAIFFLGHRDVPIDEAQKKELLAFVRDEGKGFVAAHTALTAFDSWPEFGELLGGRYDGHPWHAPGTVINEGADFPATRHFPPTFAISDEFYKPKDVLARQGARAAAARRVEDAAARRAAQPATFRSRGRRPTARAACSIRSFAHDAATWDNRDVAQMYFEAIKWALGLTEGDATPGRARHPVAGHAMKPLVAIASPGRCLLSLDRPRRRSRPAPRIVPQARPGVGRRAQRLSARVDHARAAAPSSASAGSRGSTTPSSAPIRSRSPSRRSCSRQGTGIASGEQFLARNLNYFDAIFFFGVREIDLDAGAARRPAVVRPRRRQGVRRDACRRDGVLLVARVRRDARRPLRRASVGHQRRHGDRRGSRRRRSRAHLPPAFVVDRRALSVEGFLARQASTCWRASMPRSWI